MIINPYNDILDEDEPFVRNKELGRFIGARVLYGDPRRLWTIQSFLLPSLGFAIGGLRAKLQDQKEFITFCNQRDLEVLLGLGAPGKECFWWGGKYAAPGDKNWAGVVTTERDLRDDLYEREQLIRYDLPLIPEGTSFTRRVHLEEGADVEETFVFLWDMDLTTGLSPDSRYETVQARWARAERGKVKWDLVH